MTDRGRLIVAALGGNAISLPHEEGRVEQQFAHSAEAARSLADLIEAGHRVVITHGNGPQIGNFLLRNEAAAGVIYPLPMEVAVAHVQGGMGFMIAQTLTNELAARGRQHVVTAVVTTVLVDAADPSFANPTKPVGRELSKADAERFAAGEGWSVKELSPGKYRRVVPSPQPAAIMEIEHIRRTVAAGETLVVCGGGGIPVVRDAHRGLRGVRAVIDKDFAAALLAAELRADTMLILTSVDRVRIHFGKPNEQALEVMTLADARRYLAEGHFPAGSMGPKIEAAMRFLSTSTHPHAEVLIGALEQAVAVAAGKAGTRVTR